jgi:hypothetical protein
MLIDGEEFDAQSVMARSGEIFFQRIGESGLLITSTRQSWDHTMTTLFTEDSGLLTGMSPEGRT